MKFAASVILAVPCAAAMATSLRSEASAFDKNVADLGVPPSCATNALLDTCNSQTFASCFTNCLTVGGKYSVVDGVDFNSSSISGAITTSIVSKFNFAANATGTNMLMADWNQITGSIPNAICSVSGLQGLCIGENLLRGTIPSCIFRLTNLKILSLWNNDISGSIPTGICSLSKLEGLYLDGNNLTGKIPTCMASMTSLQDVRLWKNQLTGEIPTTIGSITSLKTFIADQNHLVGTIPKSIGSLKQATYIALYNNSLTGPLPASLGSLSGSMAPNASSGFLGGQFYVSRNSFTGTIPPSFCNLVGALRFCSTGNYLDFRDCSACQPLLTAKCHTPCGTPCDFIAKTACTPATRPASAHDVVTTTNPNVNSVPDTTTTNSSTPPKIDEPRCYEDYYCNNPALECELRVIGEVGESETWTADGDYELVVLQTYDWVNDLVCSVNTPNLPSCTDQTVFEDVVEGDILETTYGGPAPVDAPNTNHQQKITSIILCNNATRAAAVKDETRAAHPARYNGLAMF